MPKPSALAATLLVAASLALEPLVQAQGRAAGAAPVAGLTEAPRLSAIYDTILAARFEEARRQLDSACPPAPGAACEALREVAWWWEIQQNQWSRRLDARLETSAARAIRSATTWTTREPSRGEAWFYLAAAYAPLSQWRVLRGERLTAARDGKRIKDALERALSLDSTLQDAWFGIGLYHYYADVAPTALKVLRFLLLLPGGDRRQGLAEMLRAREGGELVRGEADYQLHWLYLWYEDRPDRARELLRALDAKYPSNPLFLQRLAEVEHMYFSDHRASADAWRTLMDRAAARRVAFGPLADARAPRTRGRVDRTRRGVPRDRSPHRAHRHSARRTPRRPRTRAPHHRRRLRCDRRARESRAVVQERDRERASRRSGTPPRARRRGTGANAIKAMIIFQIFLTKKPGLCLTSQVSQP